MMIEMMKAPVSRAPEIVTGRILDAAEAEFMECGYEAASTNSIAARFGGSKATLFRHFPTKARLLEGVIQRIASRWREQLRWADAEPQEPQAWLLHFTCNILDWLLSDEALFMARLRISEGHKVPELDYVFQEIARRPIEALLTDRLRLWAQAGRLVVEDPDRAARHFMDLAFAGMVSRALYRRVKPKRKEVTDHAESVVEFFLNGRVGAAHDRHHNLGS